jgi:hypothetical protein
MDALTMLVLSQLVIHRPPGRSPYSMEPVVECGLNPADPSCELERVCNTPAFWCAKPRWSGSRNAWVRVETRETALRRYAEFADTLVRTVRHLTRCVDSEGVAVESCHRVRWWRGSQDLSLVATTIAIFESGLAEGTMYGHPPLGRGADGEVCMMGLMPQYTPQYATWLPEDERKRLSKAPYKEVEAWAIGALHGKENLERCLEVSLRQLVRHHRACRSVPGMFAAYASGDCGYQGKTVGMRYGLLNKMRRVREGKLPDWAVAALAPERPAEPAPSARTESAAPTPPPG